MFGLLVRRADAVRHSLLEFLRRSGHLQQVQGALLEIDRFWWTSFTEHHHPFSRCRPLGLAGAESIAGMWNDEHLETWRPPGWGDYCRWNGFSDNQSPIRIRITLWPEAEFPLEVPPYFEGYSLLWERRPEVVAASFYDLVRPLVEEGRVSRAFRWLGPRGFSVGCSEPQTSGTLGGLLAQGRRELLVSCAHVLGSFGAEVFTPGPYEHRLSARIGTVLHSVLPAQVFGSKHDCAQFGPNSPGHIDMSIAVLESGLPPEARRAVPYPQAVWRVDAMLPFRVVCFLGKESGPRLAEVKSAVIFQCIKYEDGFRCFGRLIELQHPNNPFARTAREGDSGAWLVDAEDDLVSWHGMLLGVQGPTAYACFAEDMMREVTRSSIGMASLAARSLDATGESWDD
jgi:hypothetical protein